MPVHKGYKVFNLRTRLVAKIFNADVNQSDMVREIDLIKKVSQLDFAPTLGRWQRDERWYEEEYINGSFDTDHKSPESKVLLNAFRHEIIPCMKSLLSFQEPIIRNSLEYMHEVTGVLAASLHLRKESEVTVINRINKFIHSIVERLYAEGDQPFHVVFTHGDLCPANIMISKGRLIILDWESAGFRSAFYDFYSYFFFRPVCMNVPVHQMVEEINEALQYFISRIPLTTQNSHEGLFRLMKIYRWLYYIELVFKLVERELTDKNLPILDFISGYIDAFNRYEDILEGNDIVLT